MELNDATNNKVDSRISDTTFYRIMKEKKLECFNALADVNLIIDATKLGLEIRSESKNLRRISFAFIAAVNM